MHGTGRIWLYRVELHNKGSIGALNMIIVVLGRAMEKQVMTDYVKLYEMTKEQAQDYLREKLGAVGSGFMGILYMVVE